MNKNFSLLISFYPQFNILVIQSRILFVYLHDLVEFISSTSAPKTDTELNSIIRQPTSLILAFIYIYYAQMIIKVIYTFAFFSTLNILVCHLNQQTLLLFKLSNNCITEQKQLSCIKQDLQYLLLFYSKERWQDQREQQTYPKLHTSVDDNWNSANKNGNCSLINFKSITFKNYFC